MKSAKKEIVLKYINSGLLVFFTISFVSSQYSVAISSIGVGGLVILMAARLILNRKLTYWNKTIFYLILVYVCIEIISSALCDTPGESFDSVYRHGFLMAVFFAFFMFVENTEQLKKILLVMFLFTAALSTYEIVKYLIEFSNQTGKPLSDFRLEYFGFPITNAEIKMLIILIMIPFALSKERFVLNRWLVLLLSIPVLISLYFTSSRNAMLGLFIAFLVLGILKYRVFLAAIVSVMILFILFAPPSAKERIESIIDLNHPSNHSRIVMWQTGLRMIKDKPVFGFGDSDINVIYARYKKPEFHGEGSHMHSNIFQILVMFGIPGFLSWMAIMLYIFYKQIRIFAATKSNLLLNTLALSSLISMVAFQISGLTEWNFGDAEFAVIMWFNLGMIFYVEKMLNKKEAIS